MASDISIISYNKWTQIGSPEKKNTEHTARNATGDVFDLESQCLCNVSFNQVSTTGTRYVSCIENLNIMGIDWIESFGLWDTP